MWGQLKDVRSKVTLTSVLNAVAPPVDSDEEEEYYEEEDNLSQDDDIHSQDDDREYFQNRRNEEEEEEEEEKPGGFGLVGMLTRALDTEQHTYEDSVSHEDEEEEDLFEQHKIEEQQRNASPHMEAIQEPVLVQESNSRPAKERVSRVQKEPAVVHERKSLVPDAPPQENIRTTRPTRVDSTGSGSASSSRRALVRETGSVTPTSAPRQQLAPNEGFPTLDSLPSPRTDRRTKGTGEGMSSMGSSKDGSAKEATGSRLRVPNGNSQTERTGSGSAKAGKLSVTSAKVPSRSPSDMAAIESLSGSTKPVVAPAPRLQTIPSEPTPVSRPQVAKTKTPPPPVATNKTATAATSDKNRPNAGRGAKGPTGKAAPGAPVADQTPKEVPRRVQQQPKGPPPQTVSVLQSEKKVQPAAERSVPLQQPKPMPPVRAPATSPLVEKAKAPQKPSVPTPTVSLSNGDAELAKQLEQRCKELQQQLGQAESHIVDLQQQAAQQMEKEEEAQQRQLQLFQDKEARLLEASSEDHEQDLRLLREEMDNRFTALQEDMSEERGMFQQERDQMERLLNEANSHAEATEREKQHALSRQDNDTAQHQQQQDRALSRAKDKLAQTMAMLEDRDDQLIKLKTTVKDMKSKVSEHQDGAQDAEEEMDELHTENESLRHNVEGMETEISGMREKIGDLEGEADKVSTLKLELRMLKEDYQREKAKKNSVTASAESNTAQLEGERDEALAEVHDLQQQLGAALADVEVARSDTNRVMTGNNNLQSALEAFQSEREAELSMLEEQRVESEEATAAAHAMALQATREANEAQVRETQQAADAAIKNTMDEVKQLEAQLETYRSDNVQMRRSLDEAINRLQTSQEDVIDRTLMKNILLDWLTKTGSKEKKPILAVMGSLLHFTEEEKEKVHIDEGHHALEKFMDSVAAPLPPAKADMEHLDGDNVREQWVNFLLAETDA